MSPTLHFTNTLVFFSDFLPAYHPLHCKSGPHFAFLRLPGLVDFATVPSCATMSPSPSTGSRESCSPTPLPSEQPASHRMLRGQSPMDPSSVTARDLFLDLKTRIIAARGPGDIGLKDIPPEIGLWVARRLGDDAEVERRSHRISYDPVTRYLEVVMPSPTHEAIAAWIRVEFEEARVTGFFTRLESMSIIYVPSPS